MAVSELTLVNGSTVQVKHQFGTVRRLLNEAALRSADDKGNVVAFAEFHTPEGQRRLVNPAHVIDAAQLKDADENGAGE